MNTTQKNNRHNLQPETLHDLQVSLYDWQRYNFGEQDNERVLMGMCEEAGELCHAHLKLEQGIRGSAEKLEADMRDAVGDISIYMLNYLSGMGKKLPMFAPRDDVELATDVVIIRKAAITVYRLIGKIAEDPGNEARIKHLILGLLYLCSLKGWDLESVIRDTWKVIGPRDWKRFPKTGSPDVADMSQPAAAAPSTV